MRDAAAGRVVVHGRQHRAASAQHMQEFAAVALLACGSGAGARAAKGLSPAQWFGPTDVALGQRRRIVTVFAGAQLQHGQ